MTNPVQDIYDDMAERCENIVTMSRHDMPADEPISAIGLLIADDGANVLLAIEASVDDEGMGTVTVRLYDGDCEPITPVFVELGESVMITTR